MSKRHPELRKIDEEVGRKYDEMYNKELNDPNGRQRSIDGKLYVHPDESARIREICKEYRIKLLEQFIAEHH